MSHGRKDYIYGTDGQVVSIQKDIIEPFHQDKCEALSGKPKVFIFQACEGGMMLPLFTDYRDVYVYIIIIVYCTMYITIYLDNVNHHAQKMLIVFHLARQVQLFYPPSFYLKKDFSFMNCQHC